MSTENKLADLKQQLERWRSHNEVHAKPADRILYEFLRDLLKLADYDERPESKPPPTEPLVPEQPETNEPVETETNVSFSTQTDEEGGGGNNPPFKPPTP